MLSLFNVDFWHPPGFGTFELDSLYTYGVEGFWSVFTGFFSYSYLHSVPYWHKVGSMTFFALTAVSVIYALKKYGRTSKIELILLVIGTMGSIFIITIAIGAGRYLLPFFNRMFSHSGVSTR